MKKIIITLIIIICLVSLTSCKSKNIATKSEVEAFFERIMDNNFSESTLNYSYSIEMKSTTNYSYSFGIAMKNIKQEETSKIKSKGYIEISENSETNENVINFTMNGNYTLQSESGRKITSKEKLVVFNCNFNEYHKENEESYFYQKLKVTEKGKNQKGKGKIKSQTYMNSCIFYDENFKYIFEAILDLEELIEEVFEESLSSGLVYINGSDCSMIIDSSGSSDYEKIECDIKCSGSKISKIKITVTSSSQKVVLTIDLAKNGTINKPKDYEKYI